MIAASHSFSFIKDMDWCQQFYSFDLFTKLIADWVRLYCLLKNNTGGTKLGAPIHKIYIIPFPFNCLFKRLKVNQYGTN